MTPRCSGGALFLYHALRGSRNTHVCSERPQSELQVVCVCVPSSVTFTSHRLRLLKWWICFASQAVALQSRATAASRVCSWTSASERCAQHLNKQNCVWLFGFMLLHNLSHKWCLHTKQAKNIHTKNIQPELWLISVNKCTVQKN